MNQIMVIGISAGVGKSTFARELGETLNINVYHLDTLYWKPNWVEAPLEEFSKAQQEIVNQQQWIIEGNYSNTFEIRAKQADTIIYLELPLFVCLYRVIKRWFMNIGKSRPDMGEGCKERLKWEFIKFILTTYNPRKSKMIEQLKVFQSLDPTKKIITLKSKQEVHTFIRKVRRKVNRNIRRNEERMSSLKDELLH